MVEFELEVSSPAHVSGTDPYVSFGLRIKNVQAPFTLAAVRRVLEVIDGSRVTVPEDAQIQWGYPDVWVSWRRHDPLGKYERIG